MSIPLSQLETWSNQGATVSSKTTHESIRCALVHDLSPRILTNSLDGIANKLIWRF